MRGECCSRVYMASLAVDVETTGLGHANFPPRADGVLQVGMAWREKSRVKTWSSFCNPGENFFANGWADAALQINQIPLEVIRSSRPDKEVAALFWEKVKEVEVLTGERARFLAYNRSFDEGFLSKKPWAVPKHRWGDCIMRAAASNLIGANKLKLERAMQLLQIPRPSARLHDAATDAHSALLVHEKISP